MCSSGLLNPTNMDKYGPYFEFGQREFKIFCQIHQILFIFDTPLNLIFDRDILNIVFSFRFDSNIVV